MNEAGRAGSTAAAPAYLGGGCCSSALFDHRDMSGSSAAAGAPLGWHECAGLRQRTGRSSHCDRERWKRRVNEIGGRLG